MADPRPTLGMSLRIRLSLMFFLQYAIMGAWIPVLWPYLVGTPGQGGLGFAESQAAWVCGLMGLATIVAPVIGGQIADRWVPTQWYLAAVYTTCGITMLVAATRITFGGLWPLWAVFALLAASATALTGSLSFHHLPDADRQFGGVRVFGTLGFIASGLGLSLWRTVAPVSADCLYLAGGCALAMGAACLLLPHTPPSHEGRSPWAVFEALRLLRHRPFALFLGICLVSAIGRQVYYVATSEFLEKGVGLARASVPGVMTIGQIAEVFTTALLLPIALSRLGFRRTLVLGMVAWPVRFVIFALHGWLPWPVVVGSIGLHGLAFPFVYVVSQLYVNRAAPADARASAQALFTLLTFGVGTFLGAQLSGLLLRVFATPAGRNWTAIFLIPAAITAACTLAYAYIVEEPRR